MSASIVGSGRTDTFAELLREFGAVIPAYPGEGVVPQARVPAPPLLDPALPHTHVDTLVRAYRGAVMHRQHMRTFARFKPSLELVAAAQVLCEKAIAPVAWCAWSAVGWPKLAPTNAKKPMPFGWVYNLTRLENQRWVFHKENTCVGGQTRVGPKHVKLLERWAVMKRAIVDIDPLDFPDPYPVIVKTVARVFPRGLYTVMVDDAKAEAETLQAEINAEVEAGTFPW